MPVMSPNQQEQQSMMPTQPEGRRERGTGFTNIQNLLQANVGAGTQMGTAIGQNIGAQAGQLKQDVSAAGGKFQQQFGQQMEKQKGTLSNVGALVPSTPTGISSKLSGMSKEEAQQTGEQLAKVQYGGPMGLQGAQQIGSKAASVEGLGRLAREGQGGQGLLLQNIAGRTSPYTFGQKNLDTFLMGQSKQAQKAIQRGASEAFGAQAQAQTATVGAEQAARQAKEAIAAKRSDVLQQLTKSGQDITKFAAKSAEDYLGRAERIKSILRGDVPQAQITEEDKVALSNLNQYGIDPSQYNFVDPEYVQEAINAVVSLTPTAYAGQKLYTPEQQLAARNLALLTQQSDIATDIEKSEFDKNVFQSATQGIERAQQASQQKTTDLENITNLRNPTQARSFLQSYQAGLDDFGRQQQDINSKGTGGSAERQFVDMAINRPAPGSFMAKAKELLGDQTVGRVYADLNLGGTTPYRRNVFLDTIKRMYEEKLNPVRELNRRYQNVQNLQYYLNQRFNLNPENQPIDLPPPQTVSQI